MEFREISGNHIGGPCCVTGIALVMPMFLDRTALAAYY